jgi:transcriptional regulator with XRE-family HTH domain
MSTESIPSALQRFARDLRRLREQREISISALNEATQVPESHIQKFEEGTLYEESRMNAVYLKAFVRAYAETLEIPPGAVVNQLEAALEDEYNNQLAVQFLEGPPSEADDQRSPDTESLPSPDRDAEPIPPDDSTEKDLTGVPEGVTEEHASSDSESKEPEVASDRDEEGRTESPKDDSRSPSPSFPRSGDSSASRRGASSQSSSFGSGARRVWNRYGGAVTSVALLLFVLALGGGAASLYFGGEGAGASSDPAASADLTARPASPDTSVPAETVETDTGTAETGLGSSSQSQRPSANVTLGDTLYAIVEATSVVAGMRVQQDDDLRRPYWIEEGEARVFPFTGRITIENQLDSLRLFLEHYPYPTTRTNEEGQIIISRDTAEQFADTLRGKPASFPTPSDTVQIGPAPGSDADTLAQSP